MKVSLNSSPWSSTSMAAGPTVVLPRCPRCRSKLSYEGRPCFVCIAPATFVLKDGKIRDIHGFERAENVRLPKFAQPVAIRGKKFRKPRGERTIAVARTLGRWTWNSLGVAACVHLLAVVIAMFMTGKVDEVVDYIQRVEFDEPVAAAPATAPEKDEFEVPDIKPMDDEMVLPDQVLNDPDILAGDPEHEAPPEEIYAPEPQVAPPQPMPPKAHAFLRPRSGQGLGGGQPAPSKNSPAGSGLFKNRNGDGKAAAIRIHGGGEDTENAVNLALEYLADKQNYDGSWDVKDGFKSRRDAPWYASDYRGALTALCTLPFLAAGHSPEEGKYKKNVDRSIKWLMKQQSSDGCVSFNNGTQMYTHTVATLALCEAYGLTGDEDIGDVAERAVRFLERSQGVGGGWDYRGYITSSTSRVERNDLSISGWAVLALKSAKAVGIKVNDRTWTSVSDLYDRLSLSSGETYYADRSHGELSPTRKGIGMVGVGLTARVVLDRDRFETRNIAAERLLLKQTPDYDRFFDKSYGASNPNFNTFYGWYYSTLGMFLMNNGRGPAWEKWNAALKSALLENQVLTGSRKGSWQNDDSWIGPLMGDLYSTACSALCLEVYYRYNPMHQPEDDIESLPPRRGREYPVPEVEKKPEMPENGVEIDGEVLNLDKAGHRSKYLRYLARDKGMGAVPDLLAHLEDESASVRSTALYELGKLKAKDAVAPVKRMLTQPEHSTIRLTIVDTLGRLGDRSVSSSLIRLLRDPDETIQSASQTALSRLSGGKDFGTNKRAWEDWFARNP